MSKARASTFTATADQREVKQSEIIKDGDWILKFNPADNTKNASGFALYTPGEFDPQSGTGPLGGILLSAFFYLLENCDDDFHQEIISRAEMISRELNSPAMEKTLN